MRYIKKHTIKWTSSFYFLGSFRQFNSITSMPMIYMGSGLPGQMKSIKAKQYTKNWGHKVNVCLAGEWVGHVLLDTSAEYIVHLTQARHVWPRRGRATVSPTGIACFSVVLVLVGLDRFHSSRSLFQEANPRSQTSERRVLHNVSKGHLQSCYMSLMIITIRDLPYTTGARLTQ